MSVMKINVLTVPEPMKEELERRFAGRAGLVEGADGFEWFELLRPVEGTDRYLVYTRWRDEAAFEAWRAGQSHGGPGGGGPGGPGGPGGGQGGPGGGPAPAASGADLWSFEVVQSAGPKG